MTRQATAQMALALGAVLLLSACESGKNPFAFMNRDPAAAGGTAEGAEGAAAATGPVAEQDVEAPDVFQSSDTGLWDGRPSLGGVWVAHPDVTDPERVMIRNPANGKSVIGALFRRERDNPGPKFQISSDAAAALDLLAGQPAELNVTALRREEIKAEVPATEPGTEAEAIGEEAAAALAGETIEATPIEPLAAAEAAIDAAEAAAAPAAESAAAPLAAPAPASALSNPFVQIGIFSVEANANHAADAMRAAGVLPLVKKEESQGKTFWRVIVGPATDSAERDTLLAKVKAEGYADAYLVSK